MIQNTKRVLLSVFVFCLSVFGFRTRLSPKQFKSKLYIATDTPTTILTTPSSNEWSPSSWKKYPVKQAPNYPDPVSCIFTF